MKSLILFTIFVILTVICASVAVDASPGGRKSGRKRKQKERQPEPLPVDDDDSPYLELPHYQSSYGEPDEYLDNLKVPSPNVPAPAGHTCEPIRIEACKHIGYNVTSMPNFVGHELQGDAELQLQTFMPLISYGCSSQLKFFLCSVYVPMCTEKVPVMIGPCQPLCQSVRNRCAPVLEELGFPWPEALNCSKFVPTNTIDQMCMDGPPPDYVENFQPPQIPAVFNTPKHIYPKPSINANPAILNYPLPSPPSVAIQPIDHQQQQQIPSSPAKPRKCFQYRQTEQYVFLDLPQQRQQCVPKCAANVLFSSENKQFVDYWTAVWSGLAIVSCSFTLVTFGFSSSAQFRYPERAVVYIAVCYLLYSSAYLYRAVIGRPTMSCHQEGTSGQNLLIAEAAYNPHCTLSFLMLYYFGMAGAAWFLILAATWSAAIAFRWSPDHLVQHRSLYHSFAWCAPAIQTLAALVMRAVDADELTGTCYVGNQNGDNLLRFVLLPMFFYLGTGVCLFFAALVFVRFVSVHGDDEPCTDCSAASPVSSSPTPTADTGLFLATQGETDSDPANSCHDETTGCGDFCRRIRSCSGSNGGRLQPNTGSGQSLLLPQANQFCTVSSTSSYSSAGQSQNQPQTQAFQQAFPQTALPCQQKPQRAYPSLPRPASTRASTRRGPNGVRPTRQQRRTFHLRCSGTRTNAHTGIFQPILNHNSTDESADETASVLIRSGIFAIFYILPAVCVAAANFYEYWYRDTWLLRSINRSAAAETADSSSLNSVEVRIALLESEQNRPNFEVFNMKLFMSLVIGINTGIWILTAKNPVNSWRCLFWKCFMKKMLPIVPHGSQSSGVSAGAGANNNNMQNTFGTIMNTSGGYQTTLPVHQMNSFPASINRHQNRPLPQQPMLQQQAQPLTPTYPTMAALPQGAAPSDQFFFLNDLNGPSAHMVPSFPCPTPCNGSTGTNSTLVSANSALHQAQQQHQQQYFTNCGGNLILENPTAMCISNQVQWPEHSALTHQFAPVVHRTGNETAV